MEEASRSFTAKERRAADRGWASESNIDVVTTTDIAHLSVKRSVMAERTGR